MLGGYSTRSCARQTACGSQSPPARLCARAASPRASSELAAAAGALLSCRRRAARGQRRRSRRRRAGGPQSGGARGGPSAGPDLARAGPEAAAARSLPEAPLKLAQPEPTDPIRSHPSDWRPDGRQSVASQAADESAAAAGDLWLLIGMKSSSNFR